MRRYSFSVGDGRHKLPYFRVMAVTKRRISRWGNGPAAAQAARSHSAIEGALLAASCATAVVPQTDGVI